MHAHHNMNTYVHGQLEKYEKDTYPITCTYINTHIHHPCKLTNIDTCIHTYTHTHIHTYIYTYKHTNDVVVSYYDIAIDYQFHLKDRRSTYSLPNNAVICVLILVSNPYILLMKSTKS